MITKTKEGHHDYIGKIWNQSRKVYISNVYCKVSSKKLEYSTNFQYIS